MHYQRMVFPDPATKSETISSRKGCEGEVRTQAIDPQMGSRTFKEEVVIHKPCGGPAVMGFASDVVVYPRIWRR